MKRFWGTTLVLAGLPGIACSQSQGARVAFEVVSIKPTDPFLNGQRRPVLLYGGPGSRDPGRFVGKNVSLGNIIERAYKLSDYEIAGPGWLFVERFNFEAKLPEGTTREQIPLMLRQMLEERFKMKSHHETRQMENFDLVVAKGGPKVKPSQDNVVEQDSAAGAVRPGSDPAIDSEGFPIVPRAARSQMTARTAMTDGRPHMVAIRWSMKELADFLTGQVNRPVRDATGLKGEYDFKLTWAVGNGPGSVNSNPADDQDGPAIFDAVQPQLGLKLVQSKGPVKVLVIDQIEKAPTQN